MKNLEKISRENLKLIKGSGPVGPGCPNDPAFIMCYYSGFPNGICTTRYRCCVDQGRDPEECKLES
jgi:hypothetical protein